jgi:hypothetical protein
VKAYRPLCFEKTGLKEPFKHQYALSLSGKFLDSTVKTSHCYMLKAQLRKVLFKRSTDEELERIDTPHLK